MNHTISFPCLEDTRFNVLGHAGFACLAATYLVRRPIYLRAGLAISSATLTAWGGLSMTRESCITTLVWNSLFFGINLGYVVYLRYGSNSQRNNA